jgi:hypothetical protein
LSSCNELIDTFTEECLEALSSVSLRLDKPPIIIGHYLKGEIVLSSKLTLCLKEKLSTNIAPVIWGGRLARGMKDIVNEGQKVKAFFHFVQHVQ